jgi:glycerol-3-phosphate dehydrogenase (NAD(P)+)
MKKIIIIGAGAWGTALALTILRSGHKVSLFSMCDDSGIPFEAHEYLKYLSSIKHDNAFEFITDFKTYSFDDEETNISHNGSAIAILATSAQHMGKTCMLLQHSIPHNVPLIIASKGIEKKTGKLMSQVVENIFPKNAILMLSGASFAYDVAINLPTAVSLAAKSFDLSANIAKILSNENFHIYPSTDLIGVQISGAMKNIMAIACGIIDGLGLGENTKAYVLTLGLAEIALLGKSIGARQETFMGIAGIGDIVLSCYSCKSRNYSFGMALSKSLSNNLTKGCSIKELLAAKGALTEGVHTIEPAILLAKMHNINLPITFALFNLLNEKINLDEFVSLILNQDYLN